MPGIFERLNQELESFGKRAHRRPLTTDEVTAYTDLFDLGPELVASGDAFLDGVQVVLTAMLQSPLFLYRVEESAVADADGRDHALFHLLLGAGLRIGSALALGFCLSLLRNRPGAFLFTGRTSA